MEQELLERRNVRGSIQLSSVDQTRGFETFHSGMYFRWAHGQVAGDLEKRGPPRAINTEFQGNDHILGLERHAVILFSRFANSE